MAASYKRLFQKMGKSVILLLAIIMLLCSLHGTVIAVDGKTEVIGKLYVFDEDSHYEFHESTTHRNTSKNNTYGTFGISGNIAAVNEKSGVPSYEIADGKLDFFYDYTDEKLNAAEDFWHLVDDKSKNVADMSFDSKIMKGAVIIQTSKDRKNWIDEKATFNAFSDVPIRKSSIYTATDVQLINGCYYRVIVVYELRIRTEKGRIWDKYINKKYAEVYEFYACSSSAEASPVVPNQIYSLGTKTKVESFDGYFGQKQIDKKDIHYGWELGNFFVSGYTDEVAAPNGKVVFLKNVGDKVTLWFKLNQNINGLNGNEKLSITADTEGYDQYFETAKMNFGRGVLITRYTDYNNVKAQPTIYTNYLEANAIVGANTKVQLFEEGDYEVALNYEVTKAGVTNKTGHYRIFFKFSVRNGNCMVYPFDVATGNELTNSSMTENGFRLDLAKSRYLKINLKLEVLKDSADGLVEDTRFNGPAKDGAEYTEDGIYTITVSNEYTNQFTVKKIYVGTNNILRAHMTTGLSIKEIKSLVAQGAEISDDGTMQLAGVDIKKPEKDESMTLPTTEVPANGESGAERSAEDSKGGSAVKVVFAVITVCAVVAAAAFAVIKKRKGETDSSYENTGGAK